jgi:hypothetical protein
MVWSLDIGDAYDTICDARDPYGQICRTSNIEELLGGLRMITLAASIAVPIVVVRFWDMTRGNP